MGSTRTIAHTALLAAFIAVTGAIKIPGLFPGTEFQLSAPLAVAICAVFGFKRYIIAGLLASLAGLLLGTQTLLNVFIAMIFRLTVGAVLAVTSNNTFGIIAAGPLGSAAARLALSGLLGKAVIPVLIAAVPGMIFTAIAAFPLTILLRRVRNQAERVMSCAIQR